MDLSDIDDLKQACIDAERAVHSDDWYQSWGAELAEFLAYVQGADRDTRASEAFHRRIWEDNPVSAVGQGNISVEAAITDTKFREWLADKSLTDLPEMPESRGVALRRLLVEIETQFEPYTDRTPRLKIYRVLAGFFPKDFTTVTNMRILRQLRTAMLGNRKDAGPARHINVLARLGQALGPAEDDLSAIVERMRLPWLLYRQFLVPTDDEITEIAEERPGTERLIPLPAARRRRGITGITGGFPSLLNILEFCRDGVTREDLKDQIRSINPDLKDVSVNASVNVLIADYNCLKRKGDQYVLTARGEDVLESGDPNDLVDWFITHILGVDHAIVQLRDNGPSVTSQIASDIQKVNPGWTSNWAPHLILNTLRSFGIIERDDDSVLSLTETGHDWANRIDWEPEILVVEKPGIDTGGETGKIDFTEVDISLPSFKVICERITNTGHFSEQLIQRLDAGIWANQRRHFAVLTGLSGSGKTLLARAYGQALVTGEDSTRQLCTIPVQPGWYDPSSLLGYVNPLQGDAYVRTPFLEFLLAAAREPELPFTVILDEMNLSRPEQYLAPILSAMETGSPINLHREGDMLDGVPADVRYPNNLVIIGTVNMDETTYGISDKVLDRAFTIEFWDIDLAKYQWGARDLSKEHETLARTLLEDLMKCLKPARLHFGWRTVDDVMNYMVRVNSSGNNNDPQAILDSVIYAKILPKLRGDDSPRFREALSQCADILTTHGLKDCRNKVLELQDDLETTGSARFWR